MSDKESFYSGEDIELRYMEIGIALDKIDRMNPGKVPFIIPVLNPDANKEKKVETKVSNHNTNFIVNENKAAIDVSDYEISNYIMIEIPKELVALPGATYHVEGTLNISGSGDISIDGTFSGQSSINGTLSGSGTVGPPLTYSNLSATGSVSGSGSESGNWNGSVTESLYGATVDGTLSTTLLPPYRYIEKGSKWMIAFIGGDISMPRVVCRLPD